MNHIRTVLRRLRDNREIFYEENTAKITPLGEDRAEKIIEEEIEIS